MPAASVSAGPVPAILTGTAPDFGLAILRIEPEVGGRAALCSRMPSSPASSAGSRALERAHGLRLAALEMDRRPEPGIVSARLTLER